MNDKTTFTIKSFVADIGKLRLLLAVLAFATLVLLYWVLALDAIPPDKVNLKNQFIAIDLIRALLPNLIVVPVIYILSILAFRSVSERTSEIEKAELAQTITQAILGELYERHNHVVKGAATIYSEIGDIRWDAEISRASSIDLCVQGWDWWVRTYSKEFQHFFARGGRMSVYLPDCEDENQVEAILSRLPDYDRNAWTRNVDDTWKVLQSTFLQSNNQNAGLTVYSCKNLFWYCAVRFDNASLYLSEYEGKRVARVESPTTEIDLFKHPGVQRWIAKELNHLATNPNRVVTCQLQ